MSHSIPVRIADELGARHGQVDAAVKLLDEGSAVPFIARYRKEATGGLDDTQLRRLQERLLYLRELDDRRSSILKTIVEQGKMTPDLQRAIDAAATKVELEDLYLPYKKRRRTKAQIAREAGLEPLARALLEDPDLDPETIAAGFVSANGAIDAQAALDGARFILMEGFAEDADVLRRLRKHLHQSAFLVARVVKSQKDGELAARFRDYFQHEEPLQRVPSHRALAMFRGRKEGALQLHLGLGEERAPITDDPLGTGQRAVQERFGIEDRGRKADRYLLDTARLAFRAKIALHLETELFAELREAAEHEAIAVFAANLRDLLLAAPAGQRAILGLDPGLRTGVKVAVVDRTGKLLETTTIYPHPPRNQWERAVEVLALLCRKHEVSLVSIGNGTASRETDRLVRTLADNYEELKLQKLVVSEAGASVYSASELAAREFPDVDVSLRGAVSIARRLQDPLAELVKIEPKAIGVGQYQHDLNQSRLSRSLEGVVEDCVNAVGVDVNTASEPLLARVAGLGPTLAHNIVAHRDANGPFRNRRQLLKVARLGPKAFEQAAGFLRVPHGDNPLDASAVHPEAYPVVQRILKSSGRDIGGVIGDRQFLKTVRPDELTDERFGLPTVTDILAELEKPGRDPRPEFKTAAFQEGVESLADLRAGMILEGVVSNVANFGAFVDIGVHQDGLVHVSQLADRFVEDPREVVKAGDVVKVKVLDVDLQRKRVALTLRLHEQPGGEQGARDEERRQGSGGPPRQRSGGGRREERKPVNPLADQLAKLREKLN